MSFIAIALFINENHIPKKCPFIDIALPNRFLQFSLSDCLKAIENKSGILTVLKPLILKNKRQLPELLPQWKSEIESLKLPANKTTLLEELLEYSILQRFPKLTLMEVQQMIQLTPLEKSAAVQQLIRLNVNISKKEAKKEGIRQGELIGEIRTLQRILKYPQSSQAELAEKPLKELRALLKKLKAGTEY
jgi:hypothetical protein